MKQSPINIKYDSAKLKALRYYLPKNGMALDEEMRKHLNGIYDQKVPQDIKNSIMSRPGNTVLPEENLQDQTDIVYDDDVDENKNPSRAKKNEQSLEPAVSVGQGMTMRM